jgi:hypothetical protein
VSCCSTSETPEREGPSETTCDSRAEPATAHLGSLQGVEPLVAGGPEHGRVFRYQVLESFSRVGPAPFVPPALVEMPHSRDKSRGQRRHNRTRFETGPPRTPKFVRKCGAATSQTGYGTLAVTGSAQPAGALTVTENGYTPPSGTTFVPVTWTSETGAFSPVTAPGNGVTATYGPSSLTLQAN